MRSLQTKKMFFKYLTTRCWWGGGISYVLLDTHPQNIEMGVGNVEGGRGLTSPPQFPSFPYPRVGYRRRVTPFAYRHANHLV